MHANVPKLNPFMERCKTAGEEAEEEDEMMVLEQTMMMANSNHYDDDDNHRRLQTSSYHHQQQQQQSNDGDHHWWSPSATRKWPSCFVKTTATNHHDYHHHQRQRHRSIESHKPNSNIRMNPANHWWLSVDQILSFRYVVVYLCLQILSIPFNNNNVVVLATRRHGGWSSYNAETQHSLRHHRDHIREFSCGQLFYRTFYIDPKHEVLYVGAMDNIFRLNLNNINRTHCEYDSIKLNPQSISSCIAKGKSELYDCHNHIRVIQPIGNNHSRFYVCGTNAHNPKDWIINSNLTVSNEPLPGIGNGIAKCPFDPEDNSTAIWVENGNPGDLPGLYSGSVAEFTKADTVIFRTDLYNTSTQQKVYPFKRTIKYDSKWLDKPNFVGSFDVGDYVYFFFRESAVEYINCGKNIYSRVARVCKRDTGGKNILNKNWASFLKARLNCSIPGEFPFYFNEIQSVYKYPDDDRKFYAVFTTSNNGLMGSAICTFSLNKIDEVFYGKFKEQATSSSAWLPVLSSKVPEPRPGTCVNDTQVLPDSVLNFIRGHPLMDSAVEHDNAKPIFFKRDVIFTRIVVDRLEVDGIQYTVYFSGTTTGLVYKIIEWYDQSGQVHSNLIDVIEATVPEPIRAMEISPRHKSLYVASDSVVRQIDLLMCKGRYESCTRCIQDPYCGWDRDQNECKPYTIGLMQDIMNATVGICDSTIEHKTMKVNWGQSIHMPCTIHSPDLESVIQSQGPLKWYYFRSEKSSGFEVYPKRDKFVITSDHGLVILGVTDRETGRYDCRLGPSTLFSYTLNVDAKTCSSPNESEFRKIYSDWCHEFEKYKSAMKNWQIKQSKCLAKPNHLKK